MIYNIWKRIDNGVIQNLIPNSKREAYISSLQDDKGAAVYIKIGNTAQKPDDGEGGNTPPTTGGDMHKSVYDKDSNDIVDRAERADAMVWNGSL